MTIVEVAKMTNSNRKGHFSRYWTWSFLWLLWNSNMEYVAQGFHGSFPGRTLAGGSTPQEQDWYPGISCIQNMCVENTEPWDWVFLKAIEMTDKSDKIGR